MLPRIRIAGANASYGRFHQFEHNDAAALRHREPETNLNASLLSYRLTEASLARALDGPLPELGADFSATLNAPPR